MTAWVGIGTSTGVQPWRALTYPFTSYGVLSAAITIVICVAVASGVGRGLRPWCLVGCFAVSGLGAAAAASWLVSYSSAGAAAALLGTIAATTAVKRHRRGDIRGEIVLLVVLVSLALFAGSPTGSAMSARSLPAPAWVSCWRRAGPATSAFVGRCSSWV